MGPSAKVFYAGNIHGYKLPPRFQETGSLHYLFQFRTIYIIERKYKKLRTEVNLAQVAKVKSPVQ